MSSEFHNGEEPESEPLTESWREVGGQIQGLISRIADVFREAWSEERRFDNIVKSERIEDELRTSADRMERVFKRVASETESDRAAAMKSTRQAGDRTLGEMKIAAARGLRALNEQLDDLAKSLERERRQRDQEHTPEGDVDGNHNSDHEQ